MLHHRTWCYLDRKSPRRKALFISLFLLVARTWSALVLFSKSDQEPDPRVVALSGQGEWVPAKEPLFAKYGLGPGKAFGERLANHYLKNKKYSSKRTLEESRRRREKKIKTQTIG